MADPAWRQGNYYDYGQPEKGLAVARMIGHITFMSDQSMEEKFSRRLKTATTGFKFGLDSRWKVTCATGGITSSNALTPNSYLYVTKAIDYFDLSDGRLIPNDLT